MMPCCLSVAGGALPGDSSAEVERLKRQLAHLKAEMVSAAASQEQEGERAEQVQNLNSISSPLLPMQPVYRCIHPMWRLPLLVLDGLAV